MDIMEKVKASTLLFEIEKSLPKDVDLQTKLESLKEKMISQCVGGDWTSSDYLRGMGNGILFVVALLEDKPPDNAEITPIEEKE